MSAPAKFLFEADFGKNKGADRASQAALAEAEMRGYHTGHAAAQAESKAEAERRFAAAFERIGAALGKLGDQLHEIEARLEAEAVDVAVAVAAKLAPQLIAHEPLAELSALAADCFAHLVSAPQLVVRVSDALHAQARERLQEIAAARGFDGRLIVLGESSIAPGDCRIEWADGGLAREQVKIEASISEAVARYIGVRRTNGDERGRDE